MCQLTKNAFAFEYSMGIMGFTLNDESYDHVFKAQLPPVNAIHNKTPTRKMTNKEWKKAMEECKSLNIKL